MVKNNIIIEHLLSIKIICKEHFIEGNDLGCNDCPFFSDRLGACLIREDYPYNWILNSDNIDIWRALL